jgi:hypothetical protein
MVYLNWSGYKFASKRSSIRVLQTLKSLETYIVINFRARGISRGIRKLTRIPTLIIIKKRIISLSFMTKIFGQEDGCNIVFLLILNS